MRYAASAAGDLSVMFDISWSEFLLIGIVALVVIGPKELPAVMRTLGQWTRKVRTMAAEFQNQFQEAMREAEMADLKKSVDDMARDVADLDPLKDLRKDFESVGSEVQQSLSAPVEQTPAVAEAGAEPALEAPAAAVPSDAEPAPHSDAAAPTPAADQSTPPAETPHAGADAAAAPADSAARA
jgi:sec-independent protein translocase protein TatB